MSGAGQRLPSPLPQTHRDARQRASGEMSLLALTDSARALVKAEDQVDALIDGGSLSAADAAPVLAGLQRESDAILSEATDVDAETPAGLNAKGLIARMLLKSAINGTASASVAGERFLWALVLDLTGMDDPE